MTDFTTLSLWELGFIKATALLTLAIALIGLLHRAEPCWRILVARSALVGLPILILAGLAHPLFRVPIKLTPKPTPNLISMKKKNDLKLPATSINEGKNRPVDSLFANASDAKRISNESNNGTFSPPKISLFFVFVSLWIFGSVLLLIRAVVRLLRLHRSVPRS